MKNLFSIRKYISSKKRKVHLAQCKAKLFFAVIFQISVWIMPIIPLKSLQMILAIFRIKCSPTTRKTAYNWSETENNFPMDILYEAVFN